jgi:MYXO-CTERM domain-containing protein
VGTSASINDISANSNAGAYSAGGMSAPIRQVLDRTFVRRHGYWTDTRVPVPAAEEAGDLDAVDVTFGNASWIALLESAPELRELLSIGRSVIFEWNCIRVRSTDPVEHEGMAPAEDPLPSGLLAPGAEEAARQIEGRPRPAGAPGFDLEEASCRSAGGEAGGWLLLLGGIGLALVLRKVRRPKVGEVG